MRAIRSGTCSQLSEYFLPLPVRGVGPDVRAPQCEVHPGQLQRALRQPQQLHPGAVGGVVAHAGVENQTLGDGLHQLDVALLMALALTGLVTLRGEVGEEDESEADTEEDEDKGIEPGEGQTQESVIAPGRLAFYQTFSFFRAFLAHPSSESCKIEIRNEILRVQQLYLLKIEKRVDYV